MNGSKFDAIGDSAKRRDSLYILTKALKKGNAFKLGVASILAIIGTTGGAWIPSAFANPSAPVAVLAPWTTPDGRNADELRDDSRSFAHNKNFHIRQTSAVVQDDLLNDATAIPQYDGALEDPAQYSDTSSVEEELLDPSADLQDVSDSAIEDIPDTAVAPVATPLSNASSASSLAPASEAPKTSPSS